MFHNPLEQFEISSLFSFSLDSNFIINDLVFVEEGIKIGSEIDTILLGTIFSFSVAYLMYRFYRIPRVSKENFYFMIYKSDLNIEQIKRYLQNKTTTKNCWITESIIIQDRIGWLIYFKVYFVENSLNIIDPWPNWRYYTEKDAISAMIKSMSTSRVLMIISGFYNQKEILISSRLVRLKFIFYYNYNYLKLYF
jgi:hypothetical protein